MTREEELNKASIEYRKSREECGVKDPILLDEIEDAYFMGAIWADRHTIHYNEQAMSYVRHKAVEQGKKEMLDNVCEWLEENAGSYLLYPFCEYDKGSLIEDFRKAMEGEK